MGRRLGAATAGTALIAAAVLAFSLGKHPVVAGTNTASAISLAQTVGVGETRCQRVSRVPAGVSHLLIAISYIHGEPGDLRVKIRDPQGNAQYVGGRRVIPGSNVIRLKESTTALHPANVCLHYFGPGQIVLAGERKRVPATARTGLRQGVPSIVFLRPGLATWASRRDVIADRYANDQAGALGGWSLWVAMVAAVGAAALALWWLVFWLEAPGPVRRT